MPGDALHGLKDCYKIKLRGAGYRLVYRVEDERIVILVLAIGRRARGFVYEQAEKRWTRYKKPGAGPDLKGAQCAV